MNIWKKQRKAHRQPTQPWDENDDNPCPCTFCNGKGKVETTIGNDNIKDPSKFKKIMGDCPYCGGTGRDDR